MSSENERRGWHIGREISIPSIALLLLQTGAFIFWLATLSSTVNGLVTANAKLEVELKALSTNVVVPTAVNAAQLETLRGRLFILENQMRELQTDVSDRVPLRRRSDEGRKAR